MNTRRNFLKLAGTGILASAVPSVYAATRATTPAPTKKDLFGIGIAGYTFTQLPIDTAISIMNRVNVTKLSLKDVYLPMNSTQETITSVIGKFKAAGIDVYTVGVVYMKTKEQVDQAFEYARMAGVKIIVGDPNYELLAYAEQKVKQYDIRLAIHNHGPDHPDLYPNATDIMKNIKNMDPRMGICIDIGHTTRDGQDPIADSEKYKERVFDFHIKDVSGTTKEGKTVEIGRGIIDIPRFVDTLRKTGYQGMCSLEFEKDMKDPLAGIAESIGYFKGVMAARP